MNQTTEPQFKNNPFITRDDVKSGLLGLLAPLAKLSSRGGARIKIGDTATHYDEHAAQLEGFARPLWGLASMLQGGDTCEFTEIWRKGFESGTNPECEEFWGFCRDKDQRMVEMSPIGFALATAPFAFWDPLSAQAKNNFQKWLLKINEKSMPDTNWLWFRVFANLGLKKIGAEYDHDRIQKDLKHLDTFYIGDGWSRDGPEGILQLDYYSSSFAIQTAQLLYAKIEGESDPGRAQEYKHRATLFALDFVHYFSKNGHCIPFGRSMIYRWAAVSFWSAVAYTELELPAPLTLGVVKGIILRHLRWWAKEESIFNFNDSLNIGYKYPNQFMTENYNSPGSPYWCCKAFFILALKNDHEFWKCSEQEYPSVWDGKIIPLAKPNHIVSHIGKHHFLLSSGQNCSYPIRATHAKYGKFAYSSSFGFSVPTGSFTLEQYGPDSVISISDDDGISFQQRRISTSAGIIEPAGDPVLHSFWSPFRDVTVETYLIPPNPINENWHLRAHKISTRREILVVEGGFAIYGQGRDGRHLGELCDVSLKYGEREIGANFVGCIEGIKGGLAVSKSGASGVRSLQFEGGRLLLSKEEVMRSDSNSNIMERRSVIPILTSKMQAQTTGWLVVGVYAFPSADGRVSASDISSWNDDPSIPEWLKLKIQEKVY
ncbi:hypothetical protein HK098_004149 [Nowakowskiella sp. JEL0407]|nr:hypothetical protein HK098_004149 [Nowakowskiella sp. JEL0407]